MKKILFSLLLTATVVLLAVQLSRINVHHDGTCGAQRWERHLLWMNFSEEDYDEFGIEERWTKAHNVSCKHIWLPGPLQPDDGAYWPRLNLAIAKGAPMSTILKLAKTATASDFKRKDALGRTVLHWAAIYPRARERRSLQEFLLRHGAIPSVKDNNGLIAADWEARFEAHKRGGRIDSGGGAP